MSARKTIVNKKIRLLIFLVIIVVVAACSNPVQSSTPITVFLPTSETIWKDGSEFLIQWTGGNTDSVFIQLLKGGSCVDTLAIATLNSGEFSLSNDFEWTYGDDYQILIADMISEFGYSELFSIRIWVVNVTDPNSSTLWKWGQVNTVLNWEPGPGLTVRMEIWDNETIVDDFCDWIDDDGSYTRSSVIPETWGEGSSYRIKVIDDLDNVGWSDQFTIFEAELPEGMEFESIPQ